MKGVQGVVKVLAITFAVFLICGIGATLVGVGTLVGYVFGGMHNADNTEWSEAVIGDRLDFEELDIEVGATNVRIERGDGFQILADEEVIEFRRSGNKVYLKEKDFGWFENWNKIGGELKIILPEDAGELRRFSLNAGAGTVYAEEIHVYEADIALGAGRAEFSGLNVTGKTKMDGGAGYLKLTDANLTNIDLDMGVGKVEIDGKITGSGTIDAGVGKLELRLKGSEDDYRMRFEKGLGSITVNGVSKGDGETWGNGKDLVKVDGGVGAIEIRVEEE